MMQQPKPQWAPPTLVRHDTVPGWAMVIDYRGYVLYCGPIANAWALIAALGRETEAGQSLETAISHQP